MPEHFISFPKDFLWGSGTSSFQVEGSPLADGAAKSNWYEWSHMGGCIANGDNADIAADHYHRHEEDVALMKQMGLKSYRFSISWPRIIPERGRVNEKGLDFYRRLIDELHRARIVPMATLFHWEVPVWAEGGWENRETAAAFGEYAEAVFRKLGGDVPYWVTLNEPVSTSLFGYLLGLFPPFKSDKKAFSNVVHHLNLSHGLAVRAFRESKIKGEIGWVLALAPCRPSTQNPVDIRHAKNMETLHSDVFLDPVAGKGYPPFMFEFAQKPEGPLEEDLKIISQPIDFLGVNHYFPVYVRYVAGANIVDNDFTMPDQSLLSDLGWIVDPGALYGLLVDLWRNHGQKKIFITENGIAMRDSMRKPEEILTDDLRIHYLGTYLAQVHRAIQEGVPVKGYIAWAFLDLFEWVYGFDPRFGLIHVDYRTLKRTLKKSAGWYKKVVAENGFDPDSLPKNPRYLVFEAKEKKVRNLFE